MAHLIETLERLAVAFTVSDIMIPESALKCADAKASAEVFLQENPLFDVVPIRENGLLKEYLERGSDRLKPISLQDIVSNATSIFGIVDILTGKKFVFVLVRQRIEGYVHFSDLNNSLVKLPYFVLLEAIEQQLAKETGPSIHEKNLHEVLDPQRVDAIIQKMGTLRKEKADLGWTSLLSFNEIVRFACHFGKLQLMTKEVEVISKVRNLVSHAGDQLVSSHGDVRRLAEAKRICLHVLHDFNEQG